MQSLILAAQEGLGLLSFAAWLGVLAFSVGVEEVLFEVVVVYWLHG